MEELTAAGFEYVMFCNNMTPYKEVGTSIEASSRGTIPRRNRILVVVTTQSLKRRDKSMTNPDIHSNMI
jgi:hypothetical protein